MVSDSDGPLNDSAPVQWLRVLKLLLSVVLLAVAVWEVARGVLPV